MKTPAEILAVLTPPRQVMATEYQDIYETIADGLNDVHDERESADDALVWAKSVCEEYTTYARAILARLEALGPEDKTPVSPEEL